MPAPDEVKKKVDEAQKEREKGSGGLNLPPMPAGCTATDLMQKEFPEPIWIIPELLTEGLGILAGKPKTGKSWLALGLAVASASGGRALGAVKVDSGPVLYLALEDTPRRLKSRLEQVLSGNLAPKDLHFMTSWPRIDQGALPLLQKWLEEHPETRFVIIDTLARLWPKSNGKDGSAYHADYDTVSAIKTIADLHHVSILCVTHLRKSPAEDPLETISGSMGISGSADTLLVLQRSRGKADANLLVTGRDIEEQELALRFDQITGTWLHLGGADEYRRSQEQAAILDALKAAQGPISPKEVAECCGGKAGSVRHLLGKLADEGYAARVAHGRYLYKEKISSSSVHSVHFDHPIHSIHSVHNPESERIVNGMRTPHSQLNLNRVSVYSHCEQSERCERNVKCTACFHLDGDRCTRGHHPDGIALLRECSDFSGGIRT